VGEFKRIMVEICDFLLADHDIAKCFPKSSRAFFCGFFCINNFCPKAASISQLPKQVRVVDLLCPPDIYLILAFKAIKLGWLVNWTFAPKTPPMT